MKIVRKLLALRRFKDPAQLARRASLYATLFSPRLRWQEANGFEALWARGRRRSLLDEARAQTLFQLARHAAGLSGDFAEVGVYRGGTAYLLARVARNAQRELHLFDTFAGMPETDTARDLHAAGDFSDTSVGAVRSFVGSGSHVFLHAGLFPATATAVAERAFSLVHVDVDIARSVEDCCEFFYERLVPGGVMVFDDYGFRSCPGAKSAVDAFFSAKGREPVLHMATSQAIVIRRP